MERSQPLPIPILCTWERGWCDSPRLPQAEHGCLPEESTSVGSKFPPTTLTFCTTLLTYNAKEDAEFSLPKCFTFKMSSNMKPVMKAVMFN